MLSPFLAKNKEGVIYKFIDRAYYNSIETPRG
jgi:hypothetical protein